jgi:glucokinase
VIDRRTGGVTDAANLGRGALPSSTELEAALGVPVEVVGDVEAGAVAEFGAGGLGEPDGVYLTVSTGIGAGLVLDGVLRDRDGAGEFGHVPVAAAIAQGLVCGCGGIGCLETIASGRGVAARAMLEADRSPAIAERLLAPGGVSARELAELADRGDPVSQRILDEGVDALAVAVVGLIRTLAPATIVVGGGFAVGAGISDRLEDAMRPYLRGSRLGISTVVRPAAFKRRSVLVGAALMADPTRGVGPISPRELAASDWGQRILADPGA